jgi:hypothetical protein
MRRRWYLPITVLSLGSLGVLLSTEKGRRAAKRVVSTLAEPEQGDLFAETLDAEMANIQSALAQVAKTLGREAEQVIQ